MIEILYKIYDTLTLNEKKSLTVWDLFLRAIPLSNFDKWLLTLYVDLEVIYYLVDGESPMSIARRLQVPTRFVYDVAKLYGLFVQDISLPYSVFSVYTEGMSVEKYIEITSKVLKRPLFRDVAKKHLLNVELYYDLKGIIKDYYEN